MEATQRKDGFGPEEMCLFFLHCPSKKNCLLRGQEWVVGGLDPLCPSHRRTVSLCPTTSSSPLSPTRHFLCTHWVRCKPARNGAPLVVVDDELAMVGVPCAARWGDHPVYQCFLSSFLCFILLDVSRQQPNEGE